MIDKNNLPTVTLLSQNLLYYTMEGRTIAFNGDSDVKEFITKAELSSVLKDYSGEKSAQLLARKLKGPAFRRIFTTSRRRQKMWPKFKKNFLPNLKEVMLFAKKSYSPSKIDFEIQMNRLIQMLTKISAP